MGRNREERVAREGWFPKTKIKVLPPSTMIGRKLTGLGQASLTLAQFLAALISTKAHPSLAARDIYLAFPGLLSAKADFPLITVREPETPGSRKSQKYKLPASHVTVVNLIVNRRRTPITLETKLWMYPEDYLSPLG